MKGFILGLSVLWTLNLSAQDWVQLSSLPEETYARNHPITFSLDGKGYLTTGGGVGESLIYENDFLRYDPLIDTWEILDPFPGDRRIRGYGVTTAGKAYVGFGRLGNFLDDFWEYNPSTGQWTQLATCLCPPRAHPALVAIDGKIFVGLGDNSSGDLNDWWEYDITNNIWSQKPDFPSTARHHPYFFSIGNIIYVGFGHGHPDNNSIIYNDFYKYDPFTEIWTTLNDFPGEGRVAGTQFSYNGKGYILSGQGEDHFNLAGGEFWEYNPQTDFWTELESHPGSGRWAPGTFLIDNKVYFTCGKSDFDNEKDLWVYEFPAITSLEENSLSQSHLVLIPNPSNGELFIQSDLSFEKVSIFDLQGQLINSISVHNNRLKLSNLANGIYFVKVYNDKISEIKKVVIQK